MRPSYAADSSSISPAAPAGVGARLHCSVPAPRRVKTALRWLLTVVMVGAGVNHFVNPAAYVGIMPAMLPAPLALVYISGVAEILGGLGLILPATRKLAAWGLIALLIAVFPANVNMAVNELPRGTDAVPTWMLWARLPLQLLAIAWCYWFTRDD
ncbi:MAG: DoxX family membrane protein [Deltaproteobacteria bacterium]|nr:DoxX family membrane protein [Deltaproteobacteria bacterium]